MLLMGERVEDVMAPSCDVKKVPPLALFKSSLKKSIKQTVKEVRDGDMDALIDRMDRDWESMEDPEIIERVGHELADEDADDVAREENSDSWMNQAAGAFLEVTSEDLSWLNQWRHTPPKAMQMQKLQNELHWPTRNSG